MALSQNEKGLNEKQEKFCRLYIKMMDANKAYRIAYKTPVTTKNTTTYPKASKLLARDNIKARITELRDDIEQITNQSQAKLIQNLEEVIMRSLQKKAVMVYDKELKEYVQAEDENGEGVWEYDSQGVINATNSIAKLLGYLDKAKLKELRKAQQEAEKSGDEPLSVSINL